jgi:hypothetical protein
MRATSSGIKAMPRRAKPIDDLERYVADRDARERGFAALQGKRRRK